MLPSGQKILETSPASALSSHRKHKIGWTWASRDQTHSAADLRPVPWARDTGRTLWLPHGARGGRVGVLQGAPRAPRHPRASCSDGSLLRHHVESTSRFLAPLAGLRNSGFTGPGPSHADGPGKPGRGGPAPAPVSPAMPQCTMLLCSADLKFLLGLEPVLLFFERHFFKFVNYAGGHTFGFFFSCCHSDFPTARVFLPTCF